MTDPFVAHRSLLFTVAYEMLGVAADAEDVVQETWLRWDGLGDDARAEVRDPRAYLVRIVTRQALNRLRTRGAAAGGLRRPVAARAAAHRPGRGRRRRARRERLDRDAHGAGDARAGRARRVRAPRGLRRPVRRDRRGGRQVPRRRPPDRAAGPTPCGGPAAAGRGRAASEQQAVVERFLAALHHRRRPGTDGRARPRRPDGLRRRRHRAGGQASGRGAQEGRHAPVGVRAARPRRAGRDAARSTVRSAPGSTRTASSARPSRSRSRTAGSPGSS